MSVQKKKKKGVTPSECITHQVNASLTTHKLLLADGEQTLALQHLRVGAAGIDAGQEGLFCHPDGKPLQLAVAQEAGGVHTSARREDTAENSQRHSMTLNREVFTDVSGVFRGRCDRCNI